MIAMNFTKDNSATERCDC